MYKRFCSSDSHFLALLVRRFNMYTGRGKCQCDEFTAVHSCQCDEGYTGYECDCLISDDTCRDPANPEVRFNNFAMLF